jgi:hypothetical protein
MSAISEGDTVPRDRLLDVKSVNATTLDVVRSASRTNKSRVYDHFEAKPTLIRLLGGTVHHRRRTVRSTSSPSRTRWGSAAKP